ncbi:MAG TPA: LemA family protein, partial [Candidatus Eisenbacteria bacterium]|nr:LemA family protein [Candidatus Eisenbacteria bacterium]
AVAPGSSPAEQAQQEGVLGRALGRLFAVAEAYPELKASTNFLELQRELTETEDRIAAGRRFYNANVRALNTRVESFPSNLVASTFGFTKAEYFEVEDVAIRSAPTVDFS